MSTQMTQTTSNSTAGRVKWFSLGLILCWTILIAGSLYYQLYRLEGEARGFSRVAARYSLKKDLIYWDYLPPDGLYLPESSQWPPNPLLAHIPDRDITTSTGRKLTLVTRDAFINKVLNVSQLRSEGGGRLTSLRPLRPDNAPDEWETRALKGIQQNRDQGIVSTTKIADDLTIRDDLAFAPATINGQPSYRFLATFTLQESCMTCHSGQGYKLGDVYGGISVSMPIARFHEIVWTRARPIILVHMLLWSVGTLTMLVGSRRLRQSVELLSAAETRFRLAMEATNEGLVDWHIPSNLYYHSPSCFTMLGYHPGEIGENLDSWAKLLHPEDREPSLSIIEDIRSGKVGSYEADYRLQAKDGHWRWFRTCGKVVEHDATGKPARLVATHIDITDRKRAEEEREQMESNLRQAQKMEAVGTLATGIAHDFNNLLTAIGGYTDLAKEQIPAEHPSQQTLAIVSKAVEDGSGIASSLLTFSRKTPAAKVPVVFFKVVQDSVKLLRRLLPASVKVIENYEDTDLLYVQADAGQVHQVIMNLIANARDAMPEGGTLSVSVSPDMPHQSDTSGKADRPHGLLLAVEDTGVGMTSEVASKAFDPFFTTKTRGHGTGMGLAMVHGIVQTHGGTIDVKSTPGGGTRIEIRLPSCPPPEIQPVTAAYPTQEAMLDRNVLVAEDNEFVRAVLCNALKSHGYRVIETADGSEALNQFNTSADSIDLLILDIDLPGSSGLRCREEIRKTHPTIPIVLITGSAAIGVEESQDAHSLLLRKPFKMAEMSNTIQTLLSQSKQDSNP